MRAPAPTQSEPPGLISSRASSTWWELLVSRAGEALCFLEKCFVCLRANLRLLFPSKAPTFFSSSVQSNRTSPRPRSCSLPSFLPSSLTQLNFCCNSRALLRNSKQPARTVRRIALREHLNWIQTFSPNLDLSTERLVFSVNLSSPLKPRSPKLEVQSSKLWPPLHEKLIKASAGR